MGVGGARAALHSAGDASDAAHAFELSLHRTTQGSCMPPPAKGPLGGESDARLRATRHAHRLRPPHALLLLMMVVVAVVAVWRACRCGCSSLCLSLSRHRNCGRRREARKKRHLCCLRARLAGPRLLELLCQRVAVKLDRTQGLGRLGCLG